MTLSRVVLHPAWRGAGLAGGFVRESCRACPWPWIESLAQMGHLNPFLEHAGFVRVGVCTGKSATRQGHSRIYGAKSNRHAPKALVTPETFEKSRHTRPVYYVFDNRAACRDTPAADWRLAPHGEHPPHKKRAPCRRSG